MAAPFKSDRSHWTDLGPIQEIGDRSGTHPVNMGLCFGPKRYEYILSVSDIYIQAGDTRALTYALSRCMVSRRVEVNPRHTTLPKTLGRVIHRPSMYLVRMSVPASGVRY